MRATIIPEDKTVIVDGVAVKLGAPGGVAMPAADANVHAIQLYDAGHATVEVKVGERQWLTGQAASDLVTPFLDAHAAQRAAEQAASTAAFVAALPARFKAEHRRRLALVVPPEDALDQLAAGVALLDKGKANWTAEDTALAVSLRDKRAKAKALRDARDSLIARAQALTPAQAALIDATAADPFGDGNGWPAG